MGGRRDTDKIVSGYLFYLSYFRFFYRMRWPNATQNNASVSRKRRYARVRPGEQQKKRPSVGVETVSS